MMGLVAREKAGIFKPGRISSLGNKSVGARILNFLVSRTVSNKCLLFKPPRQRYLVMVAQAN